MGNKENKAQLRKQYRKERQDRFTNESWLHILNASEIKDVNEDLMGNFQGIGVEFQIFDDTVNIINVIKIMNEMEIIIPILIISAVGIMISTRLWIMFKK